MRIALFLLTFSLELTVRAAEILEEPANCIASDQACAVEARDEKGFVLKLGPETTVTLDRGASLIRKSRNQIRLVDGTIWIKGPLSVETEFGVVEGLDEFWLSKNASGVTAMVVRSKAILKPRGSKDVLEVGEGLQNTIGDVAFNGVAKTGLPLPVMFKDFVMRWGRLYQGPKSAFETQVDRFHAKWKEAIAISAETNRLMFERKLAAVDEQTREESEKRFANEQKKAKVQAQEDELKKMFRARMLNGR